MKLNEIDKDKPGCCKGPVDDGSERDFCCNESPTSNSCCCIGEANIDEPCCCGQREESTTAGCCKQEAAPLYSNCCNASDRVDDQEQGCQANMASLEQVETLLFEANNKYMRLYAEFDNFKKRAAKERVALSNKANEQTLKELLPIVDDFERCINALEATQEKDRHIEGIKLIHDKLNGVLKRYGVTEIAIEPGSPFNADLHEAIMQQPVNDQEMQGKIVSVVEKGYLINAYVLRFAKVIIGI